MGVKVGAQAFQRMVSHYLKSLQPHTHIWIDDVPTGTRPKLCGKGQVPFQRHTSKTTFKT